MKRGEASVVIRHHQPFRVWLVTGLILAALVVGGWIVFDFGRQQGGMDAVAAAAERERLLQALEEARSRIGELRQEVTRLQSAAQVDREAHEQVRESLARLQQDNLELRQELAIYRGIVVPGPEPGIRIQAVDIVPVDGRRRYRYELTLIQVHAPNTRNRETRGRLELILEGEQDGEPRRLGLAELGPEGGRDRREFTIKYFKRLEGELVLPDGFEPRQVLLRVRPRGKGAAVVEHRTDWPVGMG